MRGWLVLILLIPGTQGLYVTGSDAPATLAPGEVWTWDLDVEVACEPLLGSVEPHAVLHVDVAAEHPGITVMGPDTFLVERSRCIGRDSITVSPSYDVVVSMHVPAETPYDVVAVASMEGQDHAATRTAVVPELVFIYNATAPVTHKMAGPQKQITYEIHLSSRSNGPIKVSFELGDRAGEGLVVLPAALILGGPGDAHREATAELVYATPYQNGNNRERENFTVAVVPESAKEAGIQGERRVMTFSAETRGLYVPGLPLALVVGGLLALAKKRV